MNKMYMYLKGLLLVVVASVAGLGASLEAAASTLTPAQNLPNTGEEFAVWGIVLGAIIIVIVLIVLFFRRKKEKENQE